MSRKYAIRYTTEDKRTLKRLQQKVNNRIYYERSKGGDTSYLPDTIKIKDLEQSIYSRADFNHQITQMKKLLDRDAMQKISTSSGEYTKGFERQVQNAVRRENIKRSVRRRKQKEIDVSKGMILGSERSDANKPRKFDLRNANKRFVSGQIENILKMGSDKYEIDSLDSYKENYIQGLIRNNASQDANGNYILDDQLKELVNKLKGIDSNTFYKAYNDDDRLSIQFRYVIEQGIDSAVDVLGEMWSKVVG